MRENIEPCTKRDFDQILVEFSDFWNDEQSRPRHHVMFVREFGDTAWVIRQKNRQKDQVIAYLLGFQAQTASYAYVHLAAVRRGHRRRGLARRLYNHFLVQARERGCREVKATVAPGNTDSIAFHESLGMTPETVEDYGGPGVDRVVFRMNLAQ